LAAVDPTDNTLVLDVVYDGPPEAGKTTSVRALARGFGRDVYTPEEQHGRTAYFDWLEHVGGRFDGAPIRFQILTVPGQQRWQERRIHLLSRADVVVFVADTSQGGWPRALQHLNDLGQRLEARTGPPVGVVFQANQRDAADAVPIDAIQAQLGSGRIALVESVASEGAGVREAFVFAVRLALDRVREQQRLGDLPAANHGPAAERLLAELRGKEPDAGAGARAAPSSLLELTTERTDAVLSTGAGRLLPDADVPSGLIWPPIEGRILLREALTSQGEASAGADGAYCTLLASGYRAHSTADAWFPQLDEAREALINWARLHAGAQPLLSRARCVVLGAAEGGFRLWQLVRVEPSLRQLFVDGCDDMIPRHAARQLASACRMLGRALALAELQASPLPCTLDSVGISESGDPSYVGDFPLHGVGATRKAGEQVAAELRALPALHDPAQRADLFQQLAHYHRLERSPLREELGALLAALESPELSRRERS
jgi:signal recognition particle receptor subunit beta